MNNQHAAVERAIDAIARGEAIIVVDDEDRENEGDLVMAAEKATEAEVARMVRHSSGILCVPLEAADARRLRLAPMVAENDAPLSTAFTVSVDLKAGLTTGISARERCATIRALADPAAREEDFVRPGHVFPLIARPGGVLMRTGHTEAAVDLARLAGCAPVGLIGELVNDDGSVQKGEDIRRFAGAQNLQIISVDQLVAYRQAREMLVERQSDGVVETAAGPVRFVRYRSRYDDAEHLALLFGDVTGDAPVLTRLHLEDAIEDVFGRQRRIETAIERIAESGRGVLIYLRRGAAGVAPRMEDGAAGVAPPVENGAGWASAAARDAYWKDVGLGAQILRDLGVTSLRVLSSRERRYVGLEGFGITVAGTDIL